MSKFGQKATQTASPVATQKPSTGSKPKTITLLDIRTVETKSGKKTKVQLAKGVTFQYNGQTVDLGEYNSAFLKDRAELESDLEYLVEKEYMTEEQANTEVDRYEEKGISFVLKTKLS